jgi:hypothetical protein
MAGVLAAAWPAALLAQPGGTAAEPDPAEEIWVVMTVKDVNPAEKQLVLALEGKNFEGVSVAAVELARHVTKKLADVGANGVQVHVLGRKQESQRVPASGQSIPAQIIQVGCVVSGLIEPAALSAEQIKNKVAWIQGTLTRVDRSLQLDGTNVQVGLDRLMLHAEPIQLADLRKSARVRVKVVRRALNAAGDKKAKEPTRLSILRLEVLADKYPAKEYSQLLGSG